MRKTKGILINILTIIIIFDEVAVHRVRDQDDNAANLYPVKFAGTNTFDKAVAICERCRSLLAEKGNDKYWTSVSTKTVSQDGQIEFWNPFAPISNNQSSTTMVRLRNPLFVLQSPCFVESASEKMLNQVKCESEQKFHCSDRVLLSSNGFTGPDCKVGDVCWSDPEEKEDPTAGCLDKPVPGTYRSDIRTDAVGSSRIVNGDEISIAKHPWYVYYSIKDNGFCGGTVISKYLVLTAYHCVEKAIKELATIWMIFGRDSLGHFKHVKPLKKTDYDILSSQESDYMDIAIFKFKYPLKLMRHRIMPIAFADYDAKEPQPYQWVFTLGFGTRCADPGKNCNNQTVYAEHLRGVDIQVTPDREKCVAKWKETRPAGQLQLTFCAGGMTTNDMGIKQPQDSCTGDSGGPLECLKSDGTVYLCGVVSMGPGPPNCGKTPGGYVRVWTFQVKDFIGKVMSEQKYWQGSIQDRSENKNTNDYDLNGSKDQNGTDKSSTSRNYGTLLVFVLIGISIYG